MNKRPARPGRIHIYTGDGKGKTTAAMGLGLRAASRGFKVCMFQFLKRPGTAAENRLALKNFKTVCLDESHPIFKDTIKGCVKKSIERDIALVGSNLGRYDLVILDEIINCVSSGFLDETALIRLIKKRPVRTEIVMTGRGATPRLIKMADYVTKCVKIRHPFDKGVVARIGIEY